MTHGYTFGDGRITDNALPNTRKVMFNLFKRTAPERPVRSTSKERRPASARFDAFHASGFADRLKATEAQESHEESAWAEWEESQIELDSRMGPQSVFESLKAHDERTSPAFIPDPFASIAARRRS